MSPWADACLLLLLCGVAWGGGSIAAPLAVGLLALAAVGTAMTLAGRRWPPWIPGIAVGVAGAHVVAAGDAPERLAWLLAPAGATAAATLVAGFAAALTRDRWIHRAAPEVGLAAALALLLLATVPAALALLGPGRLHADVWRPLVGGAAGLLQGFAVTILCAAAPGRRSLLCAIALAAAALVALAAPSHPPPLAPPARAPWGPP